MSMCMRVLVWLDGDVWLTHRRSGCLVEPLIWFMAVCWREAVYNGGYKWYWDCCCVNSDVVSPAIGHFCEEGSSVCVWSVVIIGWYFVSWLIVVCIEIVEYCVWWCLCVVACGSLKANTLLVRMPLLVRVMCVGERQVVSDCCALLWLFGIQTDW